MAAACGHPGRKDELHKKRPIKSKKKTHLIVRLWADSRPILELELDHKIPIILAAAIKNPSKNWVGIQAEKGFDYALRRRRQQKRKLLREVECYLDQVLIECIRLADWLALIDESTHFFPFPKLSLLPEMYLLTYLIYRRWYSRLCRRG